MRRAGRPAALVVVLAAAAASAKADAEAGAGSGGGGGGVETVTESVLYPASHYTVGEAELSRVLAEANRQGEVGRKEEMKRIFGVEI